MYDTETMVTTLETTKDWVKALYPQLTKPQKAMAVYLHWQLGEIVEELES